jgi:hypothetical protein
VSSLYCRKKKQEPYEQSKSKKGVGNWKENAIVPIYQTPSSCIICHSCRDIIGKKKRSKCRRRVEAETQSGSTERQDVIFGVCGGTEGYLMTPQFSTAPSPPVLSFFLKAFQKRSVSSPAPVTITWPSGLIAR